MLQINQRKAAKRGTVENITNGFFQFPHPSEKCRKTTKDELTFLQRLFDIKLCIGLSTAC
jgi:hypothetical protein